MLHGCAWWRGGQGLQRRRVLQFLALQHAAFLEDTDTWTEHCRCNLGRRSASHASTAHPPPEPILALSAIANSRCHLPPLPCSSGARRPPPTRGRSTCRCARKHASQPYAHNKVACITCQARSGSMHASGHRVLMRCSVAVTGLPQALGAGGVHAILRGRAGACSGDGSGGGTRRACAAAYTRLRTAPATRVNLMNGGCVVPRKRAASVVWDTGTPAGTHFAE